VPESGWGGRGDERLPIDSRFEHGYLEALFGDDRVGLGLVDAEMRYVRVNAALAAMNGVPVEDHEGRTVREVLPAVGEMIENLLTEVLTTKRSIVELGLSGPTPGDPDGDRQFLASYHPILEEDEAIGVGALVIEVTDRVQAQRELKAQASDIFENVVQDLAVAQLAFDAGEHDKSYESIRSALESAKHITSKVMLEEWGL
jgi:transcriptional regulator with PAS, ATPase and Fis domain